MDVLTCSRCGSSQERPASLAKATFAQIEFVCDICRCKDCSIVLGFECECGERHAEPSPEDAQVCTECSKIRQRISNLDPELLQIRNSEMVKQEPVYGVRMTLAQVRRLETENNTKLGDNID